jgi:hypothetical protein
VPAWCLSRTARAPARAGESRGWRCISHGPPRRPAPLERLTPPSPPLVPAWCVPRAERTRGGVGRGEPSGVAVAATVRTGVRHASGVSRSGAGSGACSGRVAPRRRAARLRRLAPPSPLLRPLGGFRRCGRGGLCMGERDRCGSHGPHRRAARFRRPTTGAGSGACGVRSAGRAGVAGSPVDACGAAAPWSAPARGTPRAAHAAEPAPAPAWCLPRAVWPGRGGLCIGGRVAVAVTVRGAGCLASSASRCRAGICDCGVASGGVGLHYGLPYSAR